MKGLLPHVGDGRRCPRCGDESIVHGKNGDGDPCWIAEGWAPNDSPGVQPPGVEIQFCPFCGFGFAETMEDVTEKLTASLAPLILHLLPEEWVFLELQKQALLHPEWRPVLRVVIEQGNPPVISDTYVAFREGSPRELRDPASRGTIKGRRG